LGTLNSNGQNPSANDAVNIVGHQLELRHDNDFLTFTDRYYSSGLFLTYRQLLEKGFLSSGKEQLEFSVRQEIFTPTNIISRDLEDLDRLYAGFLGIQGGWSRVSKLSLIEANLLLGVAGPASGASGFQKWYHNTFVVSDPPVWGNQMENSIHANMYASYLKEWRLAPNPFSVHMSIKPQIALGTRDSYLHPEFMASFGRRNPLSSSMIHNQLGAVDREIFFSLVAGHRFVFHNALLEGNDLGDNSVFLVHADKKVWHFGFDFKHRFGQNNYWVGYRINTPESKKTQAHRYITLSYARSF
jgi:lipid A 3-O-deacylase